MPSRPIEKLSNPRAATTASTPQPRKHWLIVGALFACTTILLVAAAWVLLSGSKEAPRPIESPPTESQSQPPKLAAVADKKPLSAPKKPTKNVTAPKFVADIKPLWESPTDGDPLNLGYLSPGAQIIAVLRPA